MQQLAALSTVQQRQQARGLRGRKQPRHRAVRGLAQVHQVALAQQAQLQRGKAFVGGVPAMGKHARACVSRAHASCC